MRIEVAGIPAPQGSKRHVGGGRMVESSRAVGPWREAVRAETQRAVFTRETSEDDKRFRMPAPVCVQIDFRLDRAKSAPKRLLWPVRRPDLDKLTRATLDGIVEGGAIADDSQVVKLYVSKRFANGDKPAGCTIWLLEPADGDWEEQ